MSEYENQSDLEDQLLELLQRIPIGSSDAQFKGRRFLITKSAFNEGRSFKIFAKELGGVEFVSANFYLTSGGLQFKPCEMPQAKVRQFLAEVELMPKPSQPG